MRNDFVPIHLKEANAALDRHVLASKGDHENHNIYKHKSLWEKFLDFFKM